MGRREKESDKTITVMAKGRKIEKEIIARGI